MSDIMNMKGTELIRELSLAFGPTGCEDAVRELIRPRAEALADKVSVARMGDLVAKMSFGNPDAENRKKIMVSAHMDEVGFMISEIRDDGMLGYGCIGGIDPSVVAGRKILVGDEKGQISGIICSKAIHQKSPEEREKAVKHDKLFMDIGATSREEAEKLVHPASPLSPETLVDKIEGNEKIANLDFSQEITVGEITNLSISYHDETLGGNVYTAECQIMIGDTPINVKLKLLSTSEGFGLYDFDIE